LTVNELIEHLLVLDQSSEVIISCEGGCVIDSDIRVIQSKGKVILEIE
jgi:hypothetical protein